MISRVQPVGQRASPIILLLLERTVAVCHFIPNPKTRLQHIITAAAINLVRVWEWWTEAYTFGTRPERFATIAPLKLDSAAKR